MTYRKKRQSENFQCIIKIAFSVCFLIFTIKFSSSVIKKNAPDITEAQQPPVLQEMNIKYTSSEERTNVSEAIDETPTLSDKDEKEEKIFQTPEDVLQFEEEYLEAFSTATPVGTVEEVFFRTSGATHTVDGISIKNTTATKAPDFHKLMNEGPVLFVKDKSEPLVLIFHTHTTESYLLSDNGVFYKGYETRSFDLKKNMVRVGDEICRVLEENGIGYIHDTTIYDESYDGAYGRSRVTVEKILKENPSIQIVLDVHRDAIYYSDTSHCKPTAEIDGKKAAQIMIITGAEEGYIKNFPHWEDNLRFALCFQKTAENSFPGLMKPLYFCQRKYNMDVSKCSLLLEMGTDANTLSEAIYSGYLTGQILTKIINESCE